MKLRVTKEFTFDAAHALRNYDGPCRNIHGHTYHLSITLKGEVSKDGFVIDFNFLKEKINKLIIQKLDHALLLDTTLAKELKVDVLYGFKVQELNTLPTCENILVYILEQIQYEWQDSVELVRLFLRETPTSFAEWILEDNI